MEELDKGIVQIQWTCGGIQEARTVVRFLVTERLVACANIIPWVESVYMWNNALNCEQETKVIMKTVRAHIPKIKEAILDNSDYEVPEILVFPVEDGNRAYLDWVRESTQVPV